MLDVQRRLNKLRQQNDRRGGAVERENWNMFRVAPTCPPSRQLHVRGGRIYAAYNPTFAVSDDYEYRAWTVPALTADLEDVNSVYVDVAFTNADWYQFFLLEMRVPGEIEEPGASDWSFYLHGTLDEFETAGEAELWLDSDSFQHSFPWEHGSIGVVSYPLCGLVLRNNGTPGAGCQILPIDLVNRGRSYLWPVDFRPITSIYD